MTSKPARRGLSADATLGLVGGCLAAASATFGVVMTVHGPQADLGTSGNFTVFAQMVRQRDAPEEARPRFKPDDLDRTATASIPARPDAAGGPVVVLQRAGATDAVVLVDGRARTVHVGDVLPGAGEVLAIVGGSRPMLRTARGVLQAEAGPASR